MDSSSGEKLSDRVIAISNLMIGVLIYGLEII